MRAALLLLAVGLTGCSGHYLDAMAPVHALAHQGRPAEGAALLERRTAKTGWDRLLVELDRGALYHRAGNWRASSEALNAAIALGDERETVSVSEELFGQAPFRMANHEKQALHALQAINYLKLAQNDEAVVEARLTDLRQRRLAAETDRSAANEHFVTGSSVDASQREFFDQLVFGRYISALAREQQGDLEGAFIDYYRALTLKRTAPLDARVEVEQLVPRVLWLADRLERPERDELKRWYPGVAPSGPAPGQGEVVVLVELGFGPHTQIDAVKHVLELIPAQRAELPLYAEAQGAPVVPEVVSSLEELAMRRGYRGVLVDRERSGTVGVNTALFFGYLLLPPLAVPLLLRRAWETTIRDSQSWELLPAEFAVARLQLPAGTHALQLPGLHGLERREVTVKAGAVTVEVVQGP
ncbi:MAG: hypothetical protein IPJ65_23820 [Archangiaceae bacterium]|nr:hypothetical protein [Archangiaceae bacterium]